MTVNAPIGIVNSALTLLGIRPGTSLTENTKGMQFMNANYEAVRDYVLTAGNWNSAQKRAALSKLSSTPDWGYDNEYQLPADFMRLVALGQSGVRGLDLRFRIEGRKILCDWDTLDILYVFRLTEVAAMDELLKNAIAARLAWVTSLGIKADMSQTQYFAQLFKDYLADANLVDANQAPVDTMTGTEWLYARENFSTGVYRPIESA